MWQAKTDYISMHGRSFYHTILGAPELLAKFGTTFAPLSNFLMKIKPIRIVMELLTGIDRNTVLPTFHSNTFRKWYKRNA
jgi:glycerol-3-phosphate dehydrogenase subunit C